MKNLSKSATFSPDRAHELRKELARKIALFIGSAEKRITDVPGLTADPADRPYGSVLSDLRAERDRGRARAKASRTRPKHFHLR